MVGRYRLRRSSFVNNTSVVCTLRFIVGETHSHLFDVSTRVRPLFRIAVTVRHTSLLATGSNPVVGSSKKIIDGFPINATPMLNLRRFLTLSHKSKPYNDFKIASAQNVNFMLNVAAA